MLKVTLEDYKVQGCCPFLLGEQLPDITPIRNAVKECFENIKKSFVVHLIKTNFFSAFYLSRGVGRVLTVYRLFTARAVQAANQMSLAGGGFLVASILQTLSGGAFFVHDMYKLAKSVQGNDVEGGVFYGLIHGPAKLASAIAGAVNTAQPIITLQTGQLMTALSTTGAVAVILHSGFVFCNGFFSLYHAHQFSQGLREKLNQGTQEWLWEQAFCRSEKALQEIEKLPLEKQEEAFQLLIQQQKERFIRRTSPECYKKLASELFGGIQNITLDNIRNYEKEKPISDDLLQMIFHHNFQRKVHAAIKMFLAAFAFAALIALVVGSGGLGLLAATGIMFAIVLFLQSGLHSRHLQKSITNWMWERQQHHILPQSIAPRENSQTNQVQFVALTTLGALTFPAWVIPATIYFQGRAAYRKFTAPNIPAV